MKQVKGVIMTLDHTNRNGRIYSSEMMKREIEKFNQRLKDGEPILGMIGGSNGEFRYAFPSISVGKRISER